VKVILFTDYITEYYIHAADEETLRSNDVVTIDIPDDLYQEWLETRNAWRDTHYKIEAAMHQAAYEAEDGDGHR